MNNRSVCRYRRILFITFVIIVCRIVFSGNVSAQAGKYLVLEHADSLVGREIDGIDARELIGNVRMLQGNVHITCDRALQFITSGQVNLSGNVVLWDDSVRLTAPRGSYYRDERRAEGFDDVQLDDSKSHLTSGYGQYLIEPRIAFFRLNVVVRDSTSTITADSLTYYRNTRQSVATGHVTVTNRPDNVTITGGSLEHDAVRQYSRVTLHPLLMQVDTTASGRQDTLFVRSRVLESYRDTVKRLVATDSVEILRADLAARGQCVQFFTQGDSILLRESPVIWYERTQVTGDSINVYLKLRKLHLVSVMGSAVAVSQSDSLRPKRLDQLTGERMRMFFADQRLSTIDVESRAISVYHLYEDSLANGLNRSSGDRIVMKFSDGKLRTIKIIGGVEGQYYPENMVVGREREYKVPGFSWRGDRPTKERFLGRSADRPAMTTERRPESSLTKKH